MLAVLRLSSRISGMFILGAGFGLVLVLSREVLLSDWLWSRFQGSEVAEIESSQAPLARAAPRSRPQAFAQVAPPPLSVAIAPATVAPVTVTPSVVMPEVSVDGKLMTSEESYFEGLVVYGSEPPVRLMNAEQAKAKAHELSNAGVPLQKLMGAHAFVDSIEEDSIEDPIAKRIYRDQAGVDLAIKLAREGYDLDRLRSTFDFVMEIQDPATKKPILRSADGFSKAMSLTQNSGFDVDQARATFDEFVAKGTPPQAALDQAVMVSQSQGAFAQMAAAPQVSDTVEVRPIEVQSAEVDRHEEPRDDSR